MRAKTEDRAAHGWFGPALATAALAGVAAMFALELGSFREAVLGWARRDLAARTELAAANLSDALATGDLRTVAAFGEKTRGEGLRLVVQLGARGVFYDSQPVGSDPVEWVEETRPCGEFQIRLALPRARVLAPFRRAQIGFALAALVGAAGVFVFFVVAWRQRVRIRELARLERFRRDFIADVSHEIKTPLTGILGAAEMLEDAPDAARARLVGMIRREGGRLDRLVREILDLARLEREGDILERTETDLAALVAETAENLRVRASERGMRIETALPRDAPKSVRCDARLVSQALSNLIVNALLHSNGTRVGIALERTDTVARLAVEDDGVGIPDAAAPRIFERFRRADPARAAETGGAGLGLAIVRRIARLHGGDVTLERVQPHGARFVLTLRDSPRSNASSLVGRHVALL